MHAANFTLKTSKMEFFILSHEDIQNEIVYEFAESAEFPNSASFPFPISYRAMLNKIKTTEVSSQTILFDAADAENENRDFINPNFWIFAANGQGDRWLLDKHNMVYFYDHNYEGSFVDMELNFEQWLQMAFLLQQLDAYIDLYEELYPDLRSAFHESLNRIHPKLSKNYPL